MTEHDTSIVLNETDREIVVMAARVLAALDRGETRADAFKAIGQAYRDDVAELHAGSDPGSLDELALGFNGALLLEMERLQDNLARLLLGGDLQARIVSPSSRRRVIKAIGRYLEMVKPFH